MFKPASKHRPRTTSGQSNTMVILALTLASACVHTGCTPDKLKDVPIPNAISLEQAIKNYNNNVANIPAFKATLQSWEAQVGDPDGKRHHYKEAGGSVSYRPPSQPNSSASLYLLARAGLAGNVLDVGANDKEYWIHWKARNGWTGNWGKHEYLGRPCAEKLAFHPTDILEALGLQLLPSDPTLPPYPVYKVAPEHNIIEYVVMTSDGLFLKRELVFSRRTNLLLSSSLYDVTGQVVMTSVINDYREIGHAQLPTEIRITWPQDDAYFVLKLSSLKEKDRYSIDPFVRREPSNMTDYQQIDRLCEHD